MRRVVLIALLLAGVLNVTAAAANVHPWLGVAALVGCLLSVGWAAA
jgi:hypothetical protein